MCEPTTLAIASMVATGAGAYQASEARKQAGQYDAAVARNNAKVAGWKASEAEDRATTSAMDIGRRTADTRGKQKAALAANGLDLGMGSPQAVLDQTDYYGLQDQRTTIENGNQEAWGYKQQASNYTTQANWSEAKASAENPMLSAGVSMLGSAANVSDKWGKRSSFSRDDARSRQEY